MTWKEEKFGGRDEDYKGLQQRNERKIKGQRTKEKKKRRSEITWMERQEENRRDLVNEDDKENKRGRRQDQE